MKRSAGARFDNRDMRGLNDAAGRPRPGLFHVGLPVVVVLAGALRLWSIDFGLPLVTHPDEPLIVDAADRMVSGRTLNPDWFRYPAFIIDVQAAIQTIVYATDWAIGWSADTRTLVSYGSGRIVMAGFGVATVALTGLLGRRVARTALVTDLPDRRQRVETLAAVAGLVAATILAVSFIHAKDSHYLKPDVPTAFFATLTLWFTVIASRQSDSERRASLLLAGASVGLAAATKYTGAVVAIVPATALLLRLRRQRLPNGVSLRQAIRIAFRMALIAGAVFLAINPYALLAPGDFFSSVDGVRAELEHYRSGHDGAEGNNSWSWYLLELWRNGIGPSLTPLVLLGGVMAVRQLVEARRQAPERDNQSGASGTDALWLIIVFPSVYYATIAGYPVRFDRQLMPILPFLAVLGGFGVASTMALVDRNNRAPRSSSRGAQRMSAAAISMTLLLVSVLAAPMMIRAVDWNIQAGEPDTRYAALAWIEENIPTGASIAREWHTPPVAQAGYHDIAIRKLNDQPLDWYRATGADYLVLSSFMYGRYLDEPERYPVEAAFYERLLSLPQVESFDGEHGPVIVIFRLDAAAPAFSTSGDAGE